MYFVSESAFETKNNFQQNVNVLEFQVPKFNQNLVFVFGTNFRRLNNYLSSSKFKIVEGGCDFGSGTKFLSELNVTGSVRFPLFGGLKGIFSEKALENVRFSRSL